jgi:hypothetical protein
MNQTKLPETSYTLSFSDCAEPTNPKAARALSLALDIRKFEIELYWKRAAYFWLFNGAALIGYLSALTGKEIENRSDALLLTSCVGLLFSVAWYLVNRASKFWQLNWEAHVDLLEDPVHGPVYKTVFDGPTPWWKLNGAYPFSVSKVNQLLSLFVVAIFFSLATNTLLKYYTPSRNWEILPTMCVICTLIGLVSLVAFGRTGQSESKITMRRRRTILERYD